MLKLWYTTLLLPLPEQQIRARLAELLAREVAVPAGTGVVRCYRGTVAGHRFKLRGPYGYRTWRVSVSGQIIAHGPESQLELASAPDWRGIAPLLLGLLLFLAYPLVTGDRRDLGMLLLPLLAAIVVLGTHLGLETRRIKQMLHQQLLYNPQDQPPDCMDGAG